MSLLVFSDLLMVVERYWPPKGHGGIRVTCGRSTKAACPVHGSAAKKSAGTGPAGAGVTCTCGSDNGLSAATTAFMASGAVGTTKWGRFAGWIDISRISVLEKSVEPAATAFYILRYPTNDEPSALDPREARRTRVGTASGKSGASMVSLDSAASSSSSNTITTPPAAAASRNSGSGGRGRTAEDPMQIEFSRILYPSETTESYGDAAYWHPQSLHEFEVDSPMTRDALFEFLNTAWDRSVARCFEATGGLSRHGSSSSRNGGAIVRRPVASLGHPELDRVDVGGQSWAVRIWDAADYARTRHDCPNALMADLTVVWDYSVSNSSDGSDMSVYYPFQACRVADRGDEWFDVTSTVLPLDAQNGAAAGDAYAELSEECETVDSWPELCRLVEQAIVMYQYVLLAYPEHHRVQQCYNRSILASLFDRNALGSSSAVKNEAVAAAPRKLFSRAKHLFSTSLRGSSSHRETLDTANLFASAYGTQQPVDPATHGTHHASSTMFGKYRSKGKGSTMTTVRGCDIAAPSNIFADSPFDSIKEQQFFKGVCV
ncbi:hypothetical protein FBU59_000514 [Linderina macrospora]|uniref:Uncharacterized protein n=1 Tax=Linderina macrospora TaxID=4868 RepID=A0ACC1JGE6_9FUNG|nr:hypothetical protein FBU59_000514 [Linderina macrospora]